MSDNKTEACEIKRHFDCDGTGQMCNICGESEAACSCDGEEDTCDCTDCDGTGRFCVTHDSPCGDLSVNPVCDAVKADRG